MAKNWMSKLSEMSDAVVEHYDPFLNVIESPSPSVNFTFGKGFGLPFGYSAVFYGPPKGGKTLLAASMVGQLHKQDPNAIAIKFDSEMREQGQLTDESLAMWGIDKNRYMAFSTNNPMHIFDRIANEFKSLVQDGMPLKLIIIDSLNGIVGRRTLNSDTIETQQMGDEALTIQVGLKSILEFQRKFRVAVIMTAHVRAEMDQLEQKRGNKYRLAAAFGTQHHAEYYMLIERNRNKDARVDALGNAFENENAGDIAGNADITAHKIRVAMKANSMGPAGRVGEFTLDYKKGIVNQHEEVFFLGVNRGIIQKPNLQTYAFGDKQWRGKEAMIKALEESPELQRDVLVALKKADAEGKFVEVAENAE